MRIERRTGNETPRPKLGRKARHNRLTRFIDLNDYATKILDYFDKNTTNLKEDLGAAVTGKIVFVDNPEQLPEPNESNEIHLNKGVTYFFVDFVDLLGACLIGGMNTTIIGGSSENCGITSTGLDPATPLFSSVYTTPIRHITFYDVGTALFIEGDGSTALDWTGVNFLNVPIIGIIKDADNFIYSKGAFLDSQGLVFDGTTGTIAFDNSIFICDGVQTEPLIEIAPTATVTRRFRTTYSSIISFGNCLGLDVDLSATIPDQGFILDTVNFSGGGIYLNGVDYDANRALFSDNVGIINSSEEAQYFMNGNAITTPIAVAGDIYKIQGSTTPSSRNQKFSHADNRQTYTGTIEKSFRVLVTANVESGNNRKIGIYIGKNGSPLPESKSYSTTSGTGRSENIVAQTKVLLTEGDYIETFTENADTTADVLVTELNVIIG